MPEYIPENNYLERDYKPFKGFSEDMCTRCEKYYKMLHEKGLTKKPFPPNCQKHIQNKILELNPTDFSSPDEYVEATIILDPIAWAQAEFGFTPRFYQEDYLSCTARFKILRIGRRAGKSLAMIIETLHHAVTNKFHTILVVAPYERQVTAFFDEMNKLIQLSSTIKSSVARYIKTPSRMEFLNGTKILGFSAGPNSSSGSVKIRGQDANLIVLDEMDYLVDEDIDATLAILASHPDCKLIAASTPAGWRKKFHQYCTDKNLGFKEFWFVAAENPTWTKETEEFFKNSYGDSYGHEFLADFLELQEGVFKARHLNASLYDYDMSLLGPEANSDYILGVDWNKSAGNHMVIVQWRDDLKKLKLVKKIITQESAYAQTEAVDLIITLNRLWQFKYIFVDRGYGTVQQELLKKHGLVDPGSMLAEKVIDIAMNQSVDVIDPISGEPVKRNAKHFLIEQTKKLLEDGFIELPKSEDTTNTAENKQMGLVQQMRNFKIEGVSVYGMPTYSQGQDHTLAAFYLACGGFYWKEGDLKGAPYSTTVRGIEITDENSKHVPYSAAANLEERKQWAEKGYVFRRTSSNKHESKPLTSREIPVEPRLARSNGLNRLRRNVSNKPPLSREGNQTYRRRSF